jgi:signal transduction histidine kinase
VSLRLRLTALYSAILLGMLAVFGVALFLTVSQVTRQTLQQTLAQEAQRLTVDPGFNLAKLYWKPKEYKFETYVQTCDRTGAILDRSYNLEQLETALSLSDTGRAAVLDGQYIVEETVVDGQALLVYTKPYKQNDEVVGCVQVARSFSEQVESLNTLRTTLLIGGALATVIAFLLGWLFAGAALRPITRITQTAQAIGAERDFSKRVDHTGPNDELGRLATTFNAMLNELRAAHEQVTHTLERQRQFVADASHELRTPLTTLRGNLSLLQREPPISPPDQKAVLNDTVDESERMMRMVNDLLTLARTDAGRPVRREVVGLQPLMEALCRQARVLAPDRDVNCLPLEALRVMGDGEALRQVLMILLDNALKYTPPHGEIVLSAEANAERVLIRVRDSGIGIAPDALPHIFERFYRGERMRSGTGVGLGLSIARSLIEVQGGALTAESQLGYGSTFTVSLPRA